MNKHSSNSYGILWRKRKACKLKAAPLHAKQVQKDFNPGARSGWVVSGTLRPLFLRERELIPMKKNVASSYMKVLRILSCSNYG
jgi:hypothetical protein